MFIIDKFILVGLSLAVLASLFTQMFLGIQLSKGNSKYLKYHKLNSLILTTLVMLESVIIIISV